MHILSPETLEFVSAPSSQLPALTLADEGDDGDVGELERPRLYAEDAPGRDDRHG